MALSLDEKLHAAVNIINASPPHRNRGMQRDVIALSCAEGGAEDGEFIETLLSVADQLVVPERCPQCADRFELAQAQPGAVVDPLGKAKCAGWFLPSEYNRDGDFYRCPWCNVYPKAVKKRHPNGASFFPSNPCRQLEIVGNIVFAEYAHLYYGEGCVSSVYAWDVEGGEINLAVCIAQRRRLVEDEHVGSEGSAKWKGAKGNKDSSGNVWTSTHVVAITPSSDQPRGFAYEMRSSLYLDLSASESTAARCSGFVSHCSKRYRSKGDKKVAVPHIAVIGQHIQKVENRLRDLVGSIYFGKMAQIVASIRGEERKKGQRMLLPTAEEASSPASPASDASPTEEGAPIWEEALDEEGNVYYHNTVTEEWSWDKPDAPVKKLKKKKKKDRSVEPQDGEEGSPASDEPQQAAAEGEEEEEAPEQTVQEVLEAIGVAVKTPKEYAKLLKKQLQLRTASDLLYLESPDETLPAEIAFGDKKKILKWIKKNMPVEE